MKVADAPSEPSDRKPMRVFLGAAVLGGRRGLGPAVAPVLGVALPLAYGLSLSGTTAGPFARLVGDAETGTATTTQALVMLGVRFEIAFGPISPFASVGTGIHYIRAEGTPTQAMNRFPVTSSAFPPLFAVGAGFSVWFRRWLAATAQIEAFFTQPMTDVVVSGMVAGRRAGRRCWPRSGCRRRSATDRARDPFFDLPGGAGRHLRGMNGKLAWAAVLAACGCSVQTLVTSEPSHAERLFMLTANWPAFAQAPAGALPRGAVDILFMVDNSSSMGPLQQQLAAGFDAFMNIIDALPGGTPDLHVGVVSSDMGVGDDSIAGCNGQGGDRGRLQFAPRGACTQTNLEPDAHFIALRTEADGSRTTNYPGGTPAQTFGCIAPLGELGCGFEQPFASVKHALDPALAPPENLGFLRRDAFLAVIMVSNEDDCIASPGVPLYDTTSNLTIGSTLGPATNFRCNEFGHLCGGMTPRARRRASSATANPTRARASWNACRLSSPSFAASRAIPRRSSWPASRVRRRRTRCT